MPHIQAYKKERGVLLMRRKSDSIFLTGAIALLTVLLSVGVASAVTEVTNVQPNADFQNDNIVVDGSIVCETIGDLVVFEATQSQGRHTGVGVLEVPCASVATVDGPFTILVFEGLSFRSGPFTLLVRIFDTNGLFLKGQGFQLKGK